MQLVLLTLATMLQAPEPIPSRLKLHLVGAAGMSDGRLRLTSSIPQTAGAAWFAEKQQVAGGFEAVFRFQLTDQGGLGPGADGFAFVLQNEGPDALAGRGSAGGFALGDGRGDPSKPGIPRSIAIFFDTFRNHDADDPSDNYIAICTNGTIPKMRWPPRRLGVGRKLRVRLKDGGVHSVRILYKPPMMSVSLDEGTPEIRVPVDLSTVVDANGLAYAGFTASTGGGFQNHDLVDWAFTPSVSSNMFVVQSDIQFFRTNCLSGKNLCTPAEVLIEQKGPGSYHVILPAHLEWGASIPNPGMRSVTIANARGTVCWDLLAGAGECGGVEGSAAGSMAAKTRAAFLIPDRNPGALVTRTERGRTWFSINGRKDRGFAENQGFFEFDVRVD